MVNENQMSIAIEQQNTDLKNCLKEHYLSLTFWNLNSRLVKFDAILT